MKYCRSYTSTLVTHNSLVTLKTAEDVNTEVATIRHVSSGCDVGFLKIETKQTNTCSMEMLSLIDSELDLLCVIYGYIMCYIHFAYCYDFLLDFGTVRQCLCGICGGGVIFILVHLTSISIFLSVKIQVIVQEIYLAAKTNSWIKSLIYKMYMVG